MRRRTLLLTMALALGVVGARAQDENGKDPFAFTLDVKEKVLANGLRVVVAPRKGAPRVACAMWFRVGSVDEVPGKTGLAHVLEHMMFKGTHRIGVKDATLGDKLEQQLDAAWARKKGLAAALGEARLAKARARERTLPFAVARLFAGAGDAASVASESTFLAANGWTAADAPYFELRGAEEDFKGLVLEERKNDRQEELWDTYVRAGGTNLNAFTSEDTTQYVVTLPANKLELFFWLEADRLKDPVFREWYPEREVVKEERYNDENSGDGPFYEALTAVVYGPHPYGHPILGWMKDLDNATPQDAMKFFKDHYAPKNATCVLAGDVDPEKAFALAERYLGSIPAREPVATEPPSEPTCPGEKRFTLEAQAESRVEIYWRAPEPTSRDRDVLDVIAEILEGENGRLWRALVEEQQLATTTEASLDNHRFAGRFHVAAHAKPETELDKLETALDAEVAMLTTDTVTAEELTRAKTRLMSDVIRGLEDLEGVVERLGQGAAILGDARAIIDRGKRLRSITAEDVQRVAKKTFRTAGRTVGVLTRGGTQTDEPETPREPDDNPQPGPPHPHPKPHRHGGPR